MVGLFQIEMIGLTTQLRMKMKPKIDDKGRFLFKKILLIFHGEVKPVKKTTKKKPVKKLKKGGVVNDPVDTNNNNKQKNTNQNQKKQNLINMFINKNDKDRQTYRKAN